MPARNVEAYIGQAIQSVLDQEWENWELWIIENDSSDQTGEIVKTFRDPRIRHLRTPIGGLSQARNLGLAMAKGDFICFLDADDRLPKRSLSSRASLLLGRPEVWFADGTVLTWSANMGRVIRSWKPSFEGVPFHEMGRIAPGCFSAITWMIRREEHLHLEFDTSWTHLEDRIFFRSIAHAGVYAFVDEVIYDIRRRPGSLMSDLPQLDAAFIRMLNEAREMGILSHEDWIAEKRVCHRMLGRSYARRLQLAGAVRHLLLYLHPE